MKLTRHDDPTLALTQGHLLVSEVVLQSYYKDKIYFRTTDAILFRNVSYPSVFVFVLAKKLFAIL